MNLEEWLLQHLTGSHSGPQRVVIQSRLPADYNGETRLYRQNVKVGLEGTFWLTHMVEPDGTEVLEINFIPGEARWTTEHSYEQDALYRMDGSAARFLNRPR